MIMWSIFLLKKHIERNLWEDLKDITILLFGVPPLLRDYLISLKLSIPQAYENLVTKPKPQNDYAAPMFDIN